MSMGHIRDRMINLVMRGFSGEGKHAYINNDMNKSPYTDFKMNFQIKWQLVWWGKKRQY